METYVCSFSITVGLITTNYIVFCHTVTEVSTIIARVENTGYKLTSVARLTNCYDTKSFMKLLQSQNNGDLLFGGLK